MNFKTAAFITVIGILLGVWASSPCISWAFFHRHKPQVSNALPPARKLPQLLPYNTDPTGDTSSPLDLWQLEQQQVFRSPVVISPDQRSMAYTEVVFIPSDRQTISTVYRVMLAPAEPPRKTISSVYSVPVPPHRQPVHSMLGSIKTALHWPGHVPRSSSRSAYPPPPEVPRTNRVQAQWDRYNPDKTVLNREQLIRVGWRRTQAFEFKTLTVVDWSPSGQRLLVKQRSGKLHLGLVPSDIWVFDSKLGESRLYPELKRKLREQFASMGDPLPGVSPEIRADLNRSNDRLTWDFEPLGWAVGTETEVLFQVWEYRKAPLPIGAVASEFPARRFRGVWSFNLETKQVTPVRPNPPWPLQALPLSRAGLTVK